MNNIIIDCLSLIKTKDGNYRKLMSSDFKYFGKDVLIYPQAKIVNPSVIEIDDYSEIDDFAFINPGKGLKIGKHVHISSFVSIIGAGECIIGDNCAFACGARVMTATNSPEGGYHMSARSLKKQQNVVVGKIIFEDDSFMGANSIILPNTTMGEGSVLGAGAVLTHNAKPWTIYVGIPARALRKRERVKF